MHNKKGKRGYYLIASDIQVEMTISEGEKFLCFRLSNESIARANNDNGGKHEVRFALNKESFTELRRVLNRKEFELQLEEPKEIN